MIEYTNSQAEQVITEWLHSDLDKNIMRLHMINGVSYERIAEIVGVSKPTVQRRIDRCRPVVRKHLN